jgi:hypothetical protein
MMFVILLPALYAARLAWRESPQSALLRVYLPVLLLLPDTFRLVLPGIPKPNFNQAVALAIVLALAARGGFRPWRISATDVMVFGFAFVCGYSEYSNTNYAEAQNLMVNMVGSVVLPYVLGRLLIERFGLRVAAAKAIVLCVALATVLALWEVRMGVNPWFSWLGLLFPGQTGWSITFRYGIVRLAGPYGGCILAGMIVVVAYRLHRWLQGGGHWEPTWKALPQLPWSKARVLRVWLIVASVLTVARGPWVGAFAGTIPFMIGQAKQRKRALIVVLAAMVIVGIPAGIAFYDYSNVNYMHAATAAQESAAYRKSLVDKYVDIAIRHSALGWGKNTYPKVPGMPSIDNHFLLLALMHGLIALALLVGTFLWLTVRLFRAGMKAPETPEGRNDFSFTLAGIFLSIFVSIGTVYLGDQVLPLTFLLFGWAESYLAQGAAQRVAAVASAAVAGPAPRFARVMR